MKHSKDSKFIKRIISAATSLALAVGIVSQSGLTDFLFDKSDIVSSADSTDTSDTLTRDIISNIWSKNCENYNIDYNNGSEKPNINFWADTTTIYTTEIDKDNVKSYDTNGIGKMIDTPMLKATSTSVKDSRYTGSNDATTDLYYTLEQASTTAFGDNYYYRKYYVSTADQLRTLFYYYGDSTRFEKIKANDTDFTNAGFDTENTTYTAADKIGIVLLCDIDLGGTPTYNTSKKKYEYKTWSSNKNVNVDLEFDGQGHTIYNGYYSGYFLGASDNKFSICNVTFSSQYISHVSGMFGNSVQHAYFSNVDWENCVAIGSNSTTIVLGSGYSRVYFKDCTIKNSVVRGAGKYDRKAPGHCGMFASYNSNSSPKNGNYHTDGVPSLEEAECAWYKQASIENYVTGNLSDNYPSIYENCAVIDGSVYEMNYYEDADTTIEAYHSGIFVSCAQGNIIFKNCFSTGRIYGNRQLGGFIGGLLGSADGFKYNGSDYDTNIVFENCYASAEVEGSSQLGGFVGVVFNDARATGDNELDPAVTTSSDSFPTSNTTVKNRGIARFRNCYSTSSVGMDYSGDYVGGFVGTLRGNIGFVEKYYEDTKIIEITGHPNIGEKAKHEFTNCYAAGEVGGITSDYAVYTAGTKTAEGSTSEDSNTETIGGFIGAYRPEDYGVNTTDITSSTSIDGIFTNCYYDKQTTAMHERDIGNYTNYDSSGNQTGDSYALSGTMGGITGVYTQTSEKKVVNGLSNTTVGTLFPTDSDKWTNENECYPQLINMKYLYGKNNSSIPPTDNDAEKAMYEERAQLFKDYAYASTAAVFLDHYDQTLTNTDELENCTETTVYDTVRDITSKFDFSTMTGISWTVNTARNKTSGDNGFHGKMGPHDVDEWENGYESDSSGGFSIDYTISDDGEKHTVTQNPYVIKIAKNATTDNKYRCVEFAPGKQWVKVTYGKASRSLRLLPSAYLSAGGEIDVNVLTDTTKNTDGTTSENTTNTVTLFDGSKRVTLDKFRHYVGVAYAISDRTRMANYNYKDLAEYKTDNGTNTDTDSFALYAGYTIGKAPNMGVGLDESTDMMYTQYFAVEGQKNDSSEGLTAVKIYKTKKGTPIEEGNKTSYQLLKDETQEITDSNSAYYTGTGNNYADTIAKWTGKANFTKEDTGYYYMEYNWRLNDGRYLSDLKLVRIKSDSHTIEMITGIANQKHTVDETAAVGTYSSAIDQYVTDEFEDSNTWTKSYPSLVKADGEGTNLTDNNATEFYKYYNTGVDGQDGYYTYDGDNYYLKANSVTTPNSDTVVGWRRTTDYELTSLIIQAKKTDSYTWETLARSDGSSNTLDFTNAQYKFNFTGILSEQDSQSKIYTITEIENDVETFSIESSVLDGIENYIKLNIDTGESSYQSYIIDDDIRVVALFRPTSANVLATKSVLINAPEPTSIEAVEGVVQSVETASKAYSVDDTGVTDNGNRKAVIGGDEITYRVKLRNAGYYDSSEVNVYDTIPDGCTFVEGSMKIYEQVKDTTTKTAVYQQAVDITDDCNTTNVNGKLTWTLPTVKLTSDYYVEYKVKVPSAGLTDTKDVLKNTATWDFVAMSGDRTKQDAGDTSIKNYQDTALFNMTIDDGDDAENAEYTITFKQKYTTSGYTYHDITFTDYLPTDFEIDSEYGIKFTDSEDNEITDVKIETDFNSTDKKFTISGFELNPNTEYKVTFKGKRVEPTEENPTVTDEATIIYYRDKVNSTDTSGNTTEGAENSEVSSTATETSSTLLGNKISKTTSLTNQVETDITHLYLNVEKTIAVDDPSQTFLFRIDRYDSSTATTPTDTYYTQVQCTTEVTTKNAETGKEEVTGYSGSQLVQVDKRGYYTVTEVTDWSSTDYDFGLSSYTDVTDTATAFDSTETSANGSVSTSTSGSTVSFALPRQQYISTAFPTTYGVPSTAPYPTVSFTNTESEYAYLSGQSYAENTIKLKTDTTTENSGDSEENGNGGNNGTGDGNGDGDDDENAN